MTSSSHHVTLGGVFVVCLVLFLFLLNGGATVISYLASSFAQYSSTIAQILAYVAVAGFATFAIKYEGISWKDIGITKRKFFLSLPVLASLGIATTLVEWLGNKWPADSISTQSGVVLPLPIVIAIVFIAAVVEEYIFRGYVQVGTRKHFGVMAGVIVSSVVFALAHVPSDIGILGVNSSSTLLSSIPLLAFSAISRFAFGVVAFAAMYELTGNIFITIFTHAFYDFSVVYYTPVGGSATIFLVCLVLPFVVVFLTNALSLRTMAPSTEQKIGVLQKD